MGRWQIAAVSVGLIFSLRSVSLLAATAAEQQENLWNNISDSRYAELPPFSNPGFWDLWKLTSSRFLAGAFINDGDEMEDGRIKVIHRFGVAAKVNWVARGDHPYTGIFASGAEHGIMRLSLATPPSSTSLTPGFGLKLLIDHQDSVNIMAMNALTGQDDPNVFAKSFSNSLPKPTGNLALLLVDHFFTGALAVASIMNGNSLHLPVQHFAERDQFGAVYVTSQAPAQLIFEPTTAAQSLMSGASSIEDFRLDLQDRGTGIHLYRVYALETKETNARRYIGDIYQSSDWIASEYGDKELFFRHHH